MVRVLLYCAAGLGGLVLLVVIVGAMLPKGHQATVTVSFRAAPEAVFDAIADVARYAEWRPDLTKVDLLPPEDGRVIFREHGKHGPITYRVEAAERPARMLVRIADRSLAFGGTWTYVLRGTAAGGTDLTITEDGEVYNPVFRFMSKFFFSPTATMEGYQKALGARLGEM